MFLTMTDKGGGSLNAIFFDAKMVSVSWIFMVCCEKNGTTKRFDPFMCEKIDRET